MGLADSGRNKERINMGEVRVIEEVKCLGREWQLQVLVKRKLPANCKVHLPGSEPTCKISRSRPQNCPAARRSRCIRGHDKGAWIDGSTAGKLRPVKIERLAPNGVQRRLHHVARGRVYFLAPAP